MKDDITKLQQDKEDRAIKLLVLKLLHLNGVIAFDASDYVLNNELEPLIRGNG